MFWKKFVVSSVVAGSVLGLVACGASEAPTRTPVSQSQAEDACPGGGACPQAEDERARCADKDPAVRYVSREPRECQVRFYVCHPGESAFFNDCGCGCAPAAP